MGEPVYVERDETVFKVWRDGTEAELGAGEQALYFRLAEALEQLGDSREEAARLQAELHAAQSDSDDLQRELTQEREARRKLPSRSGIDRARGLAQALTEHRIDSGVRHVGSEILGALSPTAGGREEAEFTQPVGEIPERKHPAEDLNRIIDREQASGQEPCPRCGGRGSFYFVKCPDCHGTGTKQEPTDD